MDPNIFKLKNIPLINGSKLSPLLSTTPPPRLLKFGFNNITEQLNIPSLTSVPYYRAGLNFDFERTDKESFSVKSKKIFPIESFNIIFASVWEIFTLWNILKTPQKIQTNDTSLIDDIIASNKNSHQHQMTKNSATLSVQIFSPVDLDENALTIIITNYLPSIIDKLEKNSTLLIQLFSIQTQITAELVNYLSSLFNEGYLIKTSVTSDLSDMKFLLLIGLKEKTTLANISSSDNSYVESIGLSNLDNTIIQCMNSVVIPKKYKKFNQIKKFLDLKVFEGITYDELIQKQNLYTKEWIQTYTTNTDLSEKLNSLLEKNNSFCDNKLEI